MVIGKKEAKVEKSTKKRSLTLPDVLLKRLSKVTRLVTRLFPLFTGNLTVIP